MSDETPAEQAPDVPAPVAPPVCGDAGGDPRAIPLLLATGLRCLSMAPALVGSAKLAVAAVDLRTLPELAPWP